MNLHLPSLHSLNFKQGREASPAPMAFILFKTLAQVVVFWGFFLFVLPTVIWQIEARLTGGTGRFAGAHWRMAGIAVFVAFGTLGLTSGAIMAWRGKGTPLPLDCAPLLVIAGPYRYIRNPMAVAGLAQGVGVGLYAGSPAIVLYALAGGPLWNTFVRPWEEADLSRRFGVPYDRYRSQVRCWRPRFMPYDPAASDSDNTDNPPAVA